jgi:hypothetical protein
VLFSIKYSQAVVFDFVFGVKYPLKGYCADLAGCFGFLNRLLEEDRGRNRMVLELPVLIASLPSV